MSLLKVPMQKRCLLLLLCMILGSSASLSAEYEDGVPVALSVAEKETFADEIKELEKAIAAIEALMKKDERKIYKLSSAQLQLEDVYDRRVQDQSFDDLIAQEIEVVPQEIKDEYEALNDRWWNAREHFQALTKHKGILEIALREGFCEAPFKKKYWTQDEYEKPSTILGYASILRQRVKTFITSSQYK